MEHGLHLPDLNRGERVTRIPVERSPLSEERRRKRRLLALLSILVAVGVGVTLITYVLLQPGPPLRIMSVAVSPVRPAAGETLTVLAMIQGGTFLKPASASLTFATFFGDEGSGGGSMVSTGENRYQGRLGPFINGTEVWFVVSAVSGSEGPVISSQMTLDVGTVVRNGPSGIAIAQVTRIPTNPDPLDIVVVTAQVTSQSTMLQVSFSYMAFYRNGQGSGGGSMIQDTSGNWTTGGMFVAPVMPRFSGTVFYYRIAAIDGTQNTATSAVYNYTLR